MFQDAVESFTSDPTREALETARHRLEDVFAAWGPYQEHLGGESGQSVRKWFASEEVDRKTLNQLIEASRCPVPFSPEMIRTLNADMQGLHAIAYLLRQTPAGETSPEAVTELYRAQPRRCAYLDSAAGLLKEKLPDGKPGT